jgi:hypothetical protein
MVSKKAGQKSESAKGATRKPPNPGSRVKARSAVTGKFVEKSYAKKHPRTTVVERISKKKGSQKARRK